MLHLSALFCVARLRKFAKKKERKKRSNVYGRKSPERKQETSPFFRQVKGPRIDPSRFGIPAPDPSHIPHIPHWGCKQSLEPCSQDQEAASQAKSAMKPEKLQSHKSSCLPYFFFCWRCLPRQAYCVWIPYRVQQLKEFWPPGSRSNFI